MYIRSQHCHMCVAVSNSRKHVDPLERLMLAPLLAQMCSSATDNDKQRLAQRLTESKLT